MASRRMNSRVRPVVLGLVVVCALALSTQALGASGGGGNVLPAQARPHGYSLTDMNEATALFSTSGNSAAYYPKTPFQILYIDPTSITQTPDGCGILSTGTFSFTVKSGTEFYVPLEFVDDSPPVLGVFPTNAAQAEPYFFDQSQIGGRNFVIGVDGSSTPVGPAYLAGPSTTPPLLDGGGTHIITLGVFLTPLSPGSHTVTITGGVFGALLQPVYGICSASESYTYKVRVLPG
ncbi:MAG: hypothetical protein JOZ99_16410 [Actinobacteria bacterium]|nr:hypothetical protein [Actinomycetota bacterium]